GASHLNLLRVNIATWSYRCFNLLRVNIATWSYRCFNVVFDYQLFKRTIAMGTKVEIVFGFLYFAEHDSSRYGSISSCFIMFSSFIRALSMSLSFSASVVNFHVFNVFNINLLTKKKKLYSWIFWILFDTFCY